MLKVRSTRVKPFFSWLIIIAMLAGLFTAVSTPLPVYATTVGTVEMSGDPGFDSDSVANSSSNQYRWLSYPGARLAMNPSPYENMPMGANLQLNAGGYLYNDIIRLLDIMSLHMSPTGGSSSNADSVSTTWYPYKIAFNTTYNSLPGVSVSGYDFFADANSSITRVIRVDGNAGKDLVLTGMLPSSAEWDSNNKALVVTGTDYYYALKFVSLSGSKLTSSDIGRTPEISAGSWSLRIPVGTASGNYYGISFGFAANSEGKQTAVSRAINCFSQGVTVALANTKNVFDTYLRKAPVPAAFGISEDIPDMGITPDKHRRAYYGAWTFLLSNMMDVLPENSSNFNYKQILCGKPSLYTGGGPYNRGSCAWESYFGQMWLAYIIPPEDAWNAYKGMMSMVDQNGYLPGEVLPSIKAQTAWNLYQRGGCTREELASEYDIIKRNLLWLELNPKWNGTSDPDEKDIEFCASFVFDSNFAIKIANEIGRSGDVAMWEEEQARTTNNIHTWFLSSQDKLYQFYFTNSGRHYSGERQGDSPIAVMNAIICSSLPAADYTRLMNYFSSGLDPLAGVGGFSGYKYPQAAMAMYGMIKKGYLSEARQYMNFVIRDTARLGNFTEAIIPVPELNGVAPSLFGAAGMIDFTLMLNGCSAYTGTPTSLYLTPNPVPSPYVNLALNRPVTVSSTESNELPGSAATDAVVTSRWSAQQNSDPQWIYVDMGTVRSINRVKLNWETAYAKSYKIQVSNDAANWTDVYSTTSGDGKADDISFTAANARYVRVYGTERGTPYGYSLFEFEVYKDPNMALKRPVTVSSTENSTFPGSAATDAVLTTRWSAQQNSDPQWIYVNLGTVRSINRVRLNWETAYAKSYKIQVSNNATDWTDVYTTTTGNGGIDDIGFTAADAQYVRIYGIERGTPYGYSLYEFGVYKDPNLALGRPVTVSSTENSSEVPGPMAVDGDLVTRWSSQYSDPQWIYVDLGWVQNINKVKLVWERAYGRSYKIQVSNDAANWTDVYSTATGDGGADDISFTAVNARYVRMYGMQRATQYGYSLHEFGVYETPSLALSRPVTVSSTENSSEVPGPMAVDGDLVTRWSSQYSDPQWIYVDLGTAQNISRVKLAWERAYGRSYKIQVSNDAANWTDVYSTATGDGGTDDISFTAVNARYVRMYGMQRGTEYGYSLHEFGVYAY